MGATTGRSFGRGVVRLLSVLALLSAVAAVPMGRADAAPPGDPPGNNGTVKIERDGPTDEDRGNEPIGDGCIIWLEFYGFDLNQTADITFTAQAPTGSGEVLLADRAVAISDDAAGGGQDRDAVIGYNLTSAIQGLKVHRQQGYHIKLSSNSLQAPGGAKHKVFWIKCAPAQVSSLRVAKATTGSGTGPFTFELNCNHRPLNTTFTLEPGQTKDIAPIPAGTICQVTETGKGEAKSTTIAETPSDTNATDGKVTLAAGTQAIVTFTNAFDNGGQGTPAPPNTDIPALPAAPGPAEVLGETLTAPAPAGPGPDVEGTTLPRTGADPTGLLTTGLWTLTAGGLALAAGRRRPRRG